MAERLPSNTTSARVVAAMGGNRESLSWIVSHFQPLVEEHIRFRLGRRFDGDSDVADLSQEVWLVALQKLRCLEAKDGHFAAVLVGFLAQTSCDSETSSRPTASTD